MWAHQCFQRKIKKTAAQIQHEHGVPVIPMGKELEPFACTKMPVNDSSEYSWFAPMDTAMVELVPDGLGWHNWVVTKFAGGNAGRVTASLAAKLLACTAVELAENPPLLQEAKDELKTRLNGRVYQPLFDESILPATDANYAEMEKFRTPEMQP